MVSVGDRVKVRDSDGEWGLGTVDSIENAKAQVTKDDWDMSYEWDECVFVSDVGDETIDETIDENEHLNEEILWELSEGTEPKLEGAVILEYQQLSKISKYSVKHESSDSICGSNSFIVVYDLNNDIVFISIENFFKDEMISKLRSNAIGESNTDEKDKMEIIQWNWSHVHPDRNDPKVFRKGNGFPGKRSQNLKDDVTDKVKQCLKPILFKVNENFDLEKDVKEFQSL